MGTLPFLFERRLSSTRKAGLYYVVLLFRPFAPDLFSKTLRTFHSRGCWVLMEDFLLGFDSQASGLYSCSGPILKMLCLLYSKAAGFIRKASGFHSKCFWDLFANFGALRPIFLKDALRLLLLRLLGCVRKASSLASRFSFCSGSSGPDLA